MSEISPLPRRRSRRRSSRKGWRGRVFRVTAALASGALVATMSSGCFAEPSPLPTIRDFLIAWQVGNYSAAAEHTTGDRAEVARALSQVEEQLDAAALRFALGQIHKEGEQAEARFSTQVDLGENGEPWQYEGRLRLRRIAGGWKILWSPSVIHPGLGEGQRLAVVTETPRRATIFDARGNSLLRATRAVIVGVHPGAIRNPRRTLGEFAEVTGLDRDRLLGRVRSAPPQVFLPLVTLQQPEHSVRAARLRQVPGLEFRTVTMPLDPALAPELVGRLGPATAERLQQVGQPYQPGDTIGVSGVQLIYQRRLAGTPTVKVVAQDPTGRQTTVLAEWRGTESQPVRTTLDKRIQTGAERALARLTAPASLAAVHVATGEVLAAANHLTRGRDAALAGRYPPGMTFSIVSTEALLEKGQKLTARIPCPATQEIGGQEFHNQGGGSGNDKTTFQAGFANSCATAFAGLAGMLSDGALAEGAGRFGIGAPWRLGEVPAFSGSIPDTDDPAETAAAVIGQGDVLVSPLSMALVAGAVESGTWRPPQLLNEPLLAQNVQAQPLKPKSVRSLRSLMRRSVTQGTARDVHVPGNLVYGVTARVRYESEGRDKLLSWFVGVRGDIAFALAVEGKVAGGKVAKRFLREISR